VYRFLEHTAELGLEVEADSLQGLFEDAALALAELEAPESRGAPARHLVALAAEDERTLLADWLNELVYLADTEAFVPTGLSRFERTSTGLEAEVEGFEDSPRPLVKAVTYHALELASGAGGVWRARVVLDV
jgi:SHS2 domain-containing protein